MRTEWRAAGCARRTVGQDRYTAENIPIILKRVCTGVKTNERKVGCTSAKLLSSNLLVAPVTPAAVGTSDSTSVAALAECDDVATALAPDDVEGEAAAAAAAGEAVTGRVARRVDHCRRYSFTDAPLLRGSSQLMTALCALLQETSGARGASGTPGPLSTSRISDQGPAPALLNARTWNK